MSSLSFWLAAAAIPLVAALVLCWPLLRQGRQWLGLGLVLLLVIPMTTLLLYQGVGSPEGIATTPGASRPGAGDAEAPADLDQLLSDARARLEAEPDDLQGWVLLARSYKTVQRFADAEYALRQAQRLAPEDPLVLVELAETLLFLGGGEPAGAEVRQLLDRALALDPTVQKGLWLEGVLAAQDGDEDRAITAWERLLTQLEPGSDVARSVQEQVFAARVRRGGADPSAGGNVNGPGAEDPAGGIDEGADPPPAWPGLTAEISVAGSATRVPDGAVLFVIARDPDAPNPPLGAVRVAEPSFPLQVTVSDANSMLAQRPLSGVPRIELSARLALSGSVSASPEDWRSAPALVETNRPQGAVRLLLKPPD